MGDPEKEMNLFGITIIVESETTYIAAGTQMKPENLIELVILMGTGKKTIEDNMN